MKISLSVKFEEHEEKIKCIIFTDNKRFCNTKRVQNQADRVDAIKRAKQLAYLGCMVQVHGYICSKKIK